MIKRGKKERRKAMRKKIMYAASILTMVFYVYRMSSAYLGRSNLY